MAGANNKSLKAAGFKPAGQAPTGWQKAAERSGMTGWQRAANDSREKRVAAMQASRGAPQTGWQRAAARSKAKK